MKSKMTRATRAELTNAIRSRYGKSSDKAKRKILDEFIAATGYHEKSAIRVLNTVPAAKVRQTRSRPSLYDEAARAALIVLWEASDRVCGKRLKALVPILLPALERNGHLKLSKEIRVKVLSMSAATIDRLLRTPRSATRARKAQQVMPEPRRRIKLRTFADWNEPPPGSMEMDLVAHCGDVNRGSYVHSLVLTDIATRIASGRSIAHNFSVCSSSSEVELPFPIIGGHEGRGNRSPRIRTNKHGNVGDGSSPGPKSQEAELTPIKYPRESNTGPPLMPPSSGASTCS